MMKYNDKEEEVYMGLEFNKKDSKNKKGK